MLILLILFIFLALNNKSLTINKNSKLKNYIPKDQLIKKFEEKKPEIISEDLEVAEDNEPEEKKIKKYKESKSQGYPSYIKLDAKCNIENNPMEVIEEEW